MVKLVVRMVEEGNDLPGVVIDLLIVQAVRRLERDLAVRGSDRGVFPWQVQGRLDIDRCEQTLRRDMARLAAAGRLERIGGDGARRGYRVARWAGSGKVTDLRDLMGRLRLAAAAVEQVA